jgi:alpha-N-acetylglucosamine transferase
VAILKEELITLEPKLKAGSEEVSKLIKVLEKQQIESDAIKNVVAADEAIAKVNSIKKITLKITYKFYSYMFQVYIIV